MPRGVPVSGKRNKPQTTQETRQKAAIASREANAAKPGHGWAAGMAEAKKRIAANQSELPLSPDPLLDRQSPSNTTNAVVVLPLIVPAPAGTFIIHVKQPPDNSLVMELHVCTHFERFPDRLVPRGMIGIGEDVIEAACVHPTGHVSGSPKSPLTFESVDQYRAFLVERYPGTKPQPAKPKTEVRRTARTAVEAKAAAQLVEEDEDLIG